MSAQTAAIEAMDVPTSRLRTHVLASGSLDAPRLVLVHGNVSSAQFFAPTLRVLGERWRCLAADMRGFGLSGAAPVDARRGVRDFADDLHALLTESGLVPDGERVHLLGWSLGGGVVLQYAIDHPETVASIVLESPMSPYGFGGTRGVGGAPCWPDFAGSGGGTANPEMVRRIAAGDRGSSDNASPRRVLRTLYGQPPFALPAQLEDELVRGMLQMATGDDFYPGDATRSPNWPGTAPGERGVNNAISPKYCDLSGFARVSDRPDVLWVRGDADQIVSDTSLVDLGNLGLLGALPGWPGAGTYPPQPMVGQMRHLLDRYRGAGGRYEEHVLPGCGHSPHLERPQEFHRLVAGFLAATGRATGLPQPAPDGAGLPVRHAGRVVVLDPADRVLLLRYDDDAPNGPHWCTPGGGVNAGEDHVSAARRELTEETGWDDVALGQEIKRRVLTMEYGGRLVRQHERIYLARTDEQCRAIGDVADMHAADGIAAWRWWTLAELDATDEVIWPAELPQLIRSVLGQAGQPA